MTTLGDLAAHPLRYGMSHEFLQRPDGMPGLRAVYGLNETSTVGMEHDLAYQALPTARSTSRTATRPTPRSSPSTCWCCATIAHFFPPYEAAPLVARRSVHARARRRRRAALARRPDRRRDDAAAQSRGRGRAARAAPRSPPSFCARLGLATSRQSPRRARASAARPAVAAALGDAAADRRSTWCSPASPSSPRS